MHRRIPTDTTTIGQRVKRAREGKDLGRPPITKKALAVMAGCSRQFLIALEQDHYKDVSATLVVALSDALEVPIRWLVSGDPMQAYQRISREEDALLALFRGLSPSMKKHVLDNLKSLLENSAAASSPTTGPVHARHHK